MTTPNDNDKALGLLRALPAEVSLEQVSQMVIAFPLVGATAAWLAWTKLHINTIIMSTTGSIIVGSSIYLFSSGGPAPHEKAVGVQELRPVETEMRQAADPAPAIVLELPAPKPAPVPPSAQATASAPFLATEPICQTAPAEAEAKAAQEDLDPLVASMHGGAARPVIAVTPAAVPRACDYTRSFELKAFQTVSLVSSFDVRVQEGDFQVVATGDEKAVQRVRVSVKDDRLIIDQEPTRSLWNGWEESVSVLVTMPLLKRAEVLGSGDLVVGAFRRAEDLTLNVQGSGDLQLEAMHEVGALTISLEGSGDVVVEEVKVSGATTIRLNGSGDVRLAGRTNGIDIGLVGSGDVMAAEMRAASAKVRLVGSGDVSVSSEGPIDQRVLGSGEVHVSGSPGGKGPRGVGAQVY